MAHQNKVCLSDSKAQKTAQKKTEPYKLDRTTTAQSSAKVMEDGRITLSLSLDAKQPDLPKDYAKDVPEFAIDVGGFESPPLMNIVIMIVGSRGKQIQYFR